MIRGFGKLMRVFTGSSFDFFRLAGSSGDAWDCCLGATMQCKDPFIRQSPGRVTTSVSERTSYLVGKVLMLALDLLFT